jgi:hypothetical protein
MREAESSCGPERVRLFAQQRARVVRPHRTVAEEREEGAVVFDIPGVTGGRLHWRTYGGSHVFRNLEKASDERRQEVSDFSRARFERSDLALPMVQAAPHRRPDVVIFGIGNPCQRQEFGSGGLIDCECRQDLLYVHDAGQQVAGLDATDLALAHAASSGQSLAGQARCFPQAVQRARQVSAILPRLDGIDVQAV